MEKLKKERRKEVEIKLRRERVEGGKEERKMIKE